MSAVFGWIQLVWPPIDRYMKMPLTAAPGAPKPGIRNLVGELLDPFTLIYKDTPLAGWLWLIVAALVFIIVLLLVLSAAQWVLRYLERSRAAVSILETRLTLTFDAPDMVRSTVAREQLVHANRHVTAYRTTSSVDNRDARIDLDSYRWSSHTEGRGTLRSTILNVGTDRQREIIEMYEQPLPTNGLATYLPNALVHRRKHWFPDTIVTRKSRLSQFNEYNGDTPLFQLTALRYPTNNAVIELQFWEVSSPDLHDIKVFLTDQNVAVPVFPTEEITPPPGMRSYVIRHKHIKAESALRITWSNANLKSYMQGRGVKVTESRPCARDLGVFSLVTNVFRRLLKAPDA
jgi:hypothetical protein